MGWKIFWAVASLLSNGVKTYWHCTWGRQKGGKSWLREVKAQGQWHKEMPGTAQFPSESFWLDNYEDHSVEFDFFVLQKCFMIWGQTLYRYSYYLLLTISFFLMNRLSYRWTTERLRNWFKIILLGRPGAFYRPWQLELTTNFFHPCVSLLR